MVGCVGARAAAPAEMLVGWAARPQAPRRGPLALLWHACLRCRSPRARELALSFACAAAASPPAAHVHAHVHVTAGKSRQHWLIGNTRVLSLAK
jgi:hypothetical protein